MTDKKKEDRSMTWPEIRAMVRTEIGRFLKDNLRRILAWLITFLAAILYNWLSHPAQPVNPVPPPPIRFMEIH